MIDFVEPCWNIDDFRNLDYKVNVAVKDYPELARPYSNSGHPESQMKLAHYSDANSMPAGVAETRKTFEQCLDSVTVGVNCFYPGWYLPLHSDPYKGYCRQFGVGVDEVIRAIVMLENSVPGQIIQVGSQTYGNWCAGQVFSWSGLDLHAFYNMSTQVRYAFQVTGMAKSKTEL